MSRSSTEVEYRALANTACEVTWVEALIAELGIITGIVPSIASDSSAAVSISKTPIFHARMKHVEIDQHLVRDKVMVGKISINKVSSMDNLADIMTKHLAKPFFLYLGIVFCMLIPLTLFWIAHMQPTHVPRGSVKIMNPVQ